MNWFCGDRRGKSILSPLHAMNFTLLLGIQISNLPVHDDHHDDDHDDNGDDDDIDDVNVAPPSCCCL